MECNTCEYCKERLEKDTRYILVRLLLGINFETHSQKCEKTVETHKKNVKNIETPTKMQKKLLKHKKMRTKKLKHPKKCEKMKRNEGEIVVAEIIRSKAGCY